MFARHLNRMTQRECLLFFYIHFVCVWNAFVTFSLYTITKRTERNEVKCVRTHPGWLTQKKKKKKRRKKKQTLNDDLISPTTRLKTQFCAYHSTNKRQNGKSNRPNQLRKGFFFRCVCVYIYIYNFTFEVLIKKGFIRTLFNHSHCCCYCCCHWCHCRCKLLSHRCCRCWLLFRWLLLKHFRIFVWSRYFDFHQCKQMSVSAFALIRPLCNR